MDNLNSCKFKEELVSYLYGEIGERDKLQFESHLPSCESCLVELDDLSLAHSSILEFKTYKFDPLQTPEIEIEYDAKNIIAPAGAQIETDPVSKPWFAAVRDLFTLSPTWATAATAFGALAICFGIYYFAVSSANQGQIAKDDLPKASPASPVDNENNKTVITPPEKEMAQTTPKPSPTPEIPQKSVNETDDGNTVPVKVSLPPTQKNKAVVKTTGSDKSVKRATPEKPSKAQPKKKGLSVPETDDEDEDTLRLADMFEELTASTTK